MSVHPIFSVSNLGKQYRDRWAVAKLNLRVSSHEIYGFLGRNGAGKTTTIRMLMGLVQPTIGQINFFGVPKDKLGTNLFRRVAATIEYPDFYPTLTARENLCYYARIRGVPAKAVEASLEFLDLKWSAHKLVKEFSLGMKQRLSLARALLHQPQLLILDEPTNGLDPAGIQEIRETIKHLNKESGITVFLSSHMLSEVEQTCTKVGIIHEGHLADEFSLDQFREQNKQYLEIKVCHPEAAVQLLNSRLGTPVCHTSEKGLLVLEDPAIQPQILNRLLVENGIEVSHLSVRSETLEHRFMHLTGGRPDVDHDPVGIY